MTEKLNSKASKIVKELRLEKLQLESCKCNQVSFTLEGIFGKFQVNRAAFSSSNSVYLNKVMPSSGYI